MPCKLKIALIVAIGAAINLTGLIDDARAGGLVECNRCASPRDAAILSGAGLTVIVDFEKVKLSAFDVEYDRELRKWRAVPTPVPTQIQQAFYRIIEATINQPQQTEKTAAR